MKRFLVVMVVILLSISLFGCGKKEANLSESEEAVSMESLSVIPTEAKPLSQVAPSTGPTSLPPAGPYKPTIEEIQTALKNANLYTGAIDGKSGPLTKKAIEEFQKANGLEVDGKVGPKTWAVLSTYLNPSAQSKR